MFNGGNLFNSLTKTNVSNIKSIYILYLFFKKKNFNKFLTISRIIFNRYFLVKFVDLFLFTFYFNKTKSILYLSFLGIFSRLFQQNKFKKFTYLNLDYTNILNKYVKLSIVNVYSKYNFLQNSKTQLELKLSNITCTPKITTSSIYKNINIFNSKNVEFQFLRKNKVYNKGRYSRCRQNYRTGVYLCMYLSIVSIFGLYY